MSFRRIATVCAAGLVIAATADAQPARVEWGLFGDYSSFADPLGLDNGFGGGTRLGVFLFSRFEVEGAVSIGSTSFSQPTGLANVDAYVPIRARLIYNQPLSDAVGLLLGGGYVNNQYVVDGVWTSQDGWGGLVGIRFNLSRRFAFRVDGTADLLPDLSDLDGGNVNYGLQTGFSLLIGSSGGGGDDWIDYDSQPLEPAPAPAEPAEDPAATAPAPDVADEPAADPDRGTPGEPAEPGQPASAEASEAQPATAPQPAVEAAEPGRMAPSAPAPAVPEGVLEGVGFKPGWWSLDSGSQAVLDRLASALLANPSARIEIIGHTDNTGSHRRNVWLSHYRAEAVKLYLTRQGVAPSRIVTAGRGPDQPIASNDTAAGRAKNRRVEVQVIR